MKIHQHTAAVHAISACFADAVVIGDVRYTQSVLVFADKPPKLWNVQSAADIRVDSLTEVASLTTAGMLVLLGVGEKPPSPNPQWQAPFIAQQSVLEVMSLRAACRTFNVLQGDGRSVLAALVVSG